MESIREMKAAALLDALRAARRRYVRSLGKPILRSIDRYIAASSLVPDQPVLDSKAFPWVAELEANWRDIRAELDEILKFREHIPRFQDVSADQYRISPDDQWRTFILYGFGYQSRLNCELCPKTTAVLQRIPDLQTAFFSILAPGKHIPRHRGVTKSLIRCHLGLMVPQQREQCYMDVGGVRCVWENGRAFVFDDRYPHEVHNDTAEERAVLLIDVERPMRRRGVVLSRIMLRLFRKTAYVVEARRNLVLWEQRLQAHLAKKSGSSDMI
ncbi:MAG: aspartyl/asparaginyl beta-hydroxylase domain-containing protein [Nitrococcus sp.]|nr:aspartyl/asparaginyl beta-hydroxylase domain-containing protein [Nitrococcus sp.]